MPDHYGKTPDAAAAAGAAPGAPAMAPSADPMMEPPAAMADPMMDQAPPPQAAGPDPGQIMQQILALRPEPSERYRESDIQNLVDALNDLVEQLTGTDMDPVSADSIDPDAPLPDDVWLAIVQVMEFLALSGNEDMTVAPARMATSSGLLETAAAIKELSESPEMVASLRQSMGLQAPDAEMDADMAPPMEGVNAADTDADMTETIAAEMA